MALLVIILRALTTWNIAPAEAAKANTRAFEASIALENSDREWKMDSVERHNFYELSRKTYAVIATAERRPYGCFMITKGVIGPDGNVM